MILEMQSDGTDQTQALQALYQRANDGDILRLTTGSAPRFILTGPVDWTGPKAVHIEATGATFYAAYDIQNKPPMIKWGAPLGARGTMNWRGGSIMGSLGVQNLSYCRVEPDGVSGGLQLILDTVCAYLRFCIPGGITGDCNVGPAIIINQLNDTAWSNRVSFRDCMAIRGGNNANAPTIQCTNKSGYAPGLWLFDGCAFEASPGVLFDVGVFSATFRDCWFEGSWSLGNTAQSPYMFNFVNPPKGIAHFFGDDYRCQIQGDFQ